jgi:hypothetical protein
MPEIQTPDLDPRAVMLLPSNDPRRLAFEAQVAEKLRADRETEDAHIAVRKAEPSRSAADCRAALRAAIEKHQAVARRLADLTKAVPKAESAVFAARSGVEQATAALERVKREAGSHRAAAAMGTAGGAAPSITDARRALEAAEDELEAAKAAAADLAKQQEEAQRQLSWSRPDDAVAAVIRTDPATKMLLETFERSRRATADLRQAVELVAGYFPYAERLALRADRIVNGPPSKQRLAWEAALAALKEDADAALPI